MSTRFERLDAPIPDLAVLRRKPVGDPRGYFERMFCAEELADLMDRPIRQINRSFTAAAGTVRGLHFQHPPEAEIKLVTCLRGEVFDVAVDLRSGSPTFLQWHAVHLRSDEHCTFVIPRGFAHGFQALTQDCELLYLTTADYAPESEGGLNPCDPRLSIDWPLPVAGLSTRDQASSFLSDDYRGITI